MMVSMPSRISCLKPLPCVFKRFSDSEPKVQQAGRADGLRSPRRAAFEDVSFSYCGNGDDPVLNRISFVAEPGRP